MKFVLLNFHLQCFVSILFSRFSYILALDLVLCVCVGSERSNCSVITKRQWLGEAIRLGFIKIKKKHPESICRKGLEVPQAKCIRVLCLNFE